MIIKKIYFNVELMCGMYIENKVYFFNKIIIWYNIIKIDNFFKIMNFNCVAEKFNWIINEIL